MSFDVTVNLERKERKKKRENKGYKFMINFMQKIAETY